MTQARVRLQTTLEQRGVPVAEAARNAGAKDIAVDDNAERWHEPVRCSAEDDL